MNEDWIITCWECKQNRKYMIFVKHIEEHLKDLNLKGKVQCKICGKDIDQIFKEDNKRYDDFEERFNPKNQVAKK